MKNIAIMGPIHDVGWDFLKQNQFKAFEIFDFSTTNLIKELKDSDGIILRTANLSKDVMSECPNLKIVARHGVGFDNVDINYLNEKKIALAVTGTSNAISVAEHVMTMFLCLSKNIFKSNELTKEGNFHKKRSLPDFFELYEKNILILGFGRIGQSLAKRCLGFESKVYVYDPFVDDKTIESKGCQKIDFIEGIKIADFISIHMPLTNETKNFIAKDELLKMKENCIIANTSRGGIINELDLVWALRERKIFAAGLDVFETEPPIKNHPLFTLNNVLLTPHNAALTLECRKRMALECAKNIFHYLQNSKDININNFINRKNLEL